MGTGMRLWGGRILQYTGLVVLLAFAFFMSFLAGERGFYPFSQSFAFDGAYRALIGQVPFKDFVFPVGPLTGVLLLPFFQVLGVSYFSYLTAAATINALATLCSFFILRRVFPRKPFFAFLAAFLTAVWFYSPNGTPYEDQTSFFFSLLGGTLLLSALIPPAGICSKRRVRFMLFFLSGASALLSLISKQNAGLFFLPVYFVLLFADSALSVETDDSWWRSWLYFLTGFLAGAGLFLAWLFWKSDVQLFIQYVFRLPAQTGLQRLLSREFFAESLHMAKTTSEFFLAGLSVCFLIALFRFLSLRTSFLAKKPCPREELMASLLCLCLIIFQYAYQRTTYNIRENSFPFVGVICALAIGFLFSWVCGRRKFLIPIAVLSGLWILYASVFGINVAFSRKALTFPAGFIFSEPLKLKGVEHLRLGAPDATVGYYNYVREDDFTGLYHYLEGQKKNFFIYPDMTIFYGLMKVPSPQPLLAFHRGLTYPLKYDPDLDRWIVEDLKKNHVEIVVLQKVYFQSLTSLDDFPKLKTYIFENFTKTREIGIFEIYEKVWV